MTNTADPKEEQDIDVTVSMLEWEVVNQALNAPFRDQWLQAWMKVNWPEVSEKDLDKAIESVKEKWFNAWE